MAETADDESPWAVKDGDHIEFLCQDSLAGEIPAPEPANKMLPDWYQDLPMEGETRPTVKSCVSFLDALTMGWILKAPADIHYHLQPTSEGVQVDIEADCEFGAIAPHYPEQVNGERFPAYPAPILKIYTQWAVRTPDGYSTLVTKPMNRIEGRFQPFSGVIDSDRSIHLVKAPSLWTDIGSQGVIEKGTPVVQVIPFKRDGLLTDGVVTQFEGDTKRRFELDKQIYTGETTGHYREVRWEPKDGTRIIRNEIEES